MKLTLQDVTQKKNEFEKAGITLRLMILKQFIKRHLRSLYGFTLEQEIFSAAILQDCRKIC